MPLSAKFVRFTAAACLSITVANLTLAATAPTSQPISVLPTYLHPAKAAMDAGRYKEALATFQQAVAAHPNDYEPLHCAGIACLYLRNDEQAKQFLKQAIALAPSADRALSYNYAVALMNLADYRPAAQALRDYLYARPNVLDEPLADALGTCLYQTGEKNAVSRASDDSRKFYSVYLTMLESKRPGMKKWGIKWLPAAEVDERTKKMRDAEREITLEGKGAQVAVSNVDEGRASFREAQSAQARLARAQEVVDDLRPEYPALLLPISPDDATPPPFKAMDAPPQPPAPAPAPAPVAADKKPKKGKVVAVAPVAPPAPIETPQPTAVEKPQPAPPEQPAPAPTVNSSELNGGISPDSLKQCHVASDGTISVDHEVKLSFDGTDHRDFNLSGEIFLGGGDDVGGALFCFREANGTHRYEISYNRIRAKRLLVSGQNVSKFADTTIADAPRNEWIKFNFQVSEKEMDITFDGKSGTIKGPLSMSGGNGVILRAGAKLRSLQLDVAK